MTTRYGRLTATRTLYDALGRAVSSQQRTAGEIYGFGYTYLLNDALASVTYPSGLLVTKTYDDAGRLIQAGKNGASATAYLQGATYAPHGAPAWRKLGNGLEEETEYNRRLQPTEMEAGSLLTLSFGYGTTDNNGNMLTQRIRMAGSPGLDVTQTYEYDGVNRLLEVDEGGWSRAYEYDRWGNRAIAGTGVGPGQPGALGAFDTATNRLTTTWADYDAAGNLSHFKVPSQSAFDWTAAYDGENKQRYFCADTSTACGSGNATADYRYDGEGRRVRKLTASEAITYVYDAFGRLAAEYSTQGPTGPGGRYFRTTDHLGSTRLVTDANGDVASRRDYFPFGEEIPANATFNDRHLVADGQAQTTYNRSSGFAQKFTGKERDAETGLDYFGARYFSASLGRFTGADEPFADQFESDPQSWNLYGYVRNNPLRFFDPTGRACKQLADGNFEGDCSSPGDERVTQGGKAQEETVTALSPPSPLFLAVAQGTQRAKPIVDAAAVGTAVIVGGGTVAMAAGVSGLTTIGTAGAPLVPLVPKLQTTLQQGFRVVGQGLTRIRAITNGRLKGFNRGNTELQGGDQAARSVFQRISGRLPSGDFDRAVSGGREVVYRSAQRAGSEHPKIEIVDSAQRFLEKITFK